MLRKNPLQSLEFDKVLRHVAEFARSNVSRESVLGIRPYEHREAVETRLGEVAELRRLAQEGTPVRILSFTDVIPYIERARPEGAVLEPLELAAIGRVLYILDGIYGQIPVDPRLPRLNGLAGHITGFPKLLAAIDRAVDSEGGILDTASPALYDIRNRIRGLEGRIRKRLEETLREKNIEPFLQADFITKRSGRWVVPVRMDSKGQVAGVVHDVSRSGETAFVEPLEIIGMANELENLHAEEKAEVIRILREISAGVRGVADALESEFGTLVYLDMLRSIADFSEKHGLAEPEINEDSVLKLEGARHPLLMLMGHQVVPLEMELGADGRVMVITGPNAGGKTISVKTAGLLLAMALSGMPVPARGSSNFPVPARLLVDIGDEQSIEESLSTFSAHIANISDIVKRAGPGTVAIMDELGTGTDPAQGAAIACAVLTQLRDKGALVLATTHLTDIIAFVTRTGRMVNASMEFDRESFTPLYRLRRGEPGQSHALAIARRFGLPEDTLALAQEMLGTMNLEFQDLLEDLKEKRKAHEEALARLEAERAAMEKDRGKIREELAQAERERKEYLRRAYEEAHNVVAGIRREVNAIVEEARRERARGREAAKKLAAIDAEVEARLEETSGVVPLAIEEIEEGDTVFVKPLGFDARVAGVDMKKKRVRLLAGGKEFEFPAQALAKSRGRPAAEAPQPRPAAREEPPVPARLQLIGMRVDEALPVLERHLNDASLAGLNEVLIVHGMGTGALRKAVREYLESHPLVSGFRQGEPPEGGAGVTVAKLR